MGTSAMCRGEEKAGVCCQQAEQEPGVVSLYKPFAPSQGFTVSRSLLKTEGMELRVPTSRYRLTRGHILKHRSGTVNW
jgi:hypothetical protein